MKGKFTWLITALLCLMVYAPAQGAIVWDHESLLYPGQTTTLVENYPVLANGGQFAYVPVPHGMPTYYQPSNNVPPGTKETSTITENFDGHGQMTLNASAQGEVVGDGFKAQAQTSITFNDADGPANHFNANGNAAVVHQSVTAILTRQFVNDGGNMIADLTAQLDGLVNFNSLDEVAEYKITANINLLELRKGVPDSAFGYRIEMTKDPDTWNQVLEDIVLRPMDQGFYYQLNCSLNVDVGVKNLDIDQTGFTGLELNGPFLLGQEGPLTLNAGQEGPFTLTAGLTDVHPAPIPASLLLLLSGISGLAVWRYFGRKVH